MATVEEIVFLGTGTSSSVPTIACLTDPKKKCSVCLSAVTPEGFKNNRKNTSMVVRFRKHKDPPGARLRYIFLALFMRLPVCLTCFFPSLLFRNVLIDCGKTFYSNKKEKKNQYKKG